MPPLLTDESCRQIRVERPVILRHSVRTIEVQSYGLIPEQSCRLVKGELVLQVKFGHPAGWRVIAIEVDFARADHVEVMGRIPESLAPCDRPQPRDI